MKEYIHWLKTVLIPDLKESGTTSTARDFEKCIRYMEKSSANDLILQFTKVQHAIMANNEAYDDDLGSSWKEMKKEYVKLQRMMEEYIVEGEC